MKFTNYIELDNKDNQDELPIYTGTFENVPNTLIPGIYTGTIAVRDERDNVHIAPITVLNGLNGHVRLFTDLNTSGAIDMNATTYN